MPKDYSVFRIPVVIGSTNIDIRTNSIEAAEYVTSGTFPCPLLDDLEVEITTHNISSVMSAKDFCRFSQAVAVARMVVEAARGKLCPGCVDAIETAASTGECDNLSNMVHTHVGIKFQ